MGAPDWELCLNPTSVAELRQLADEVFELSHNPRRDQGLESRVCFACNLMMDGDGGWAFTNGMKGALAFISQLLWLRAEELDRLRPSYCPPPQTPSPTERAGAANNRSGDTQ